MALPKLCNGPDVPQRERGTELRGNLRHSVLMPTELPSKRRAANRNKGPLGLWRLPPSEFDARDLVLLAFYGTGAVLVFLGLLSLLV